MERDGIKEVEIASFATFPFYNQLINIITFSQHLGVYPCDTNSFSLLYYLGALYGALFIEGIPAL